MENTELIKRFYESIANADAESMVECYHQDIQFEDPAFGNLKKADAKNMWRMLVERGNGNIKIDFWEVEANEKSGSAKWRAEYVYAATKRKVVNNISAKFEFQDGKIIKHTDDFDLWKWTKQALGVSGYLLGWSSFMKGKIQKQTNALLEKEYIEKFKMKNILIPLPDKDFDLTEVSVPWKLLKSKGHKIVFATEKGKVAETDPLLITGVVFGQLGAKKEAITFYREMEKSEEFLHPITYDEINVNEFDLLHLPGGHAKGVKQYLESKVLQKKVVEFFKQKKIVGSICHGAVVLARSIDADTGKSIVYHKKMTALTKILERTGYFLTAWKWGKLYRTYPEYTQDEVCRNLANKNQFVKGNPLKPMVVEDGNLVTARFPDDAYLYANALIEKLEAEEKFSS